MASDVTWTKPATDELMKTYDALMAMGLDQNFALVVLDQMKNRVAEQFRAAGIGTVQGGRREQMLNELMAKEAFEVIKWAKEMQFKALQAAGPVAGAMERKPVHTPGSGSFLAQIAKAIAESGGRGIGEILTSYLKEGAEGVYNWLKPKEEPGDWRWLEWNDMERDWTGKYPKEQWGTTTERKPLETEQLNTTAAPGSNLGVTGADTSLTSPARTGAGGAISPFLYDNRDWNTPAETQQGWSSWYTPSYTPTTQGYPSYDYDIQVPTPDYGSYYLEGTTQYSPEYDWTQSNYEAPTSYLSYEIPSYQPNYSLTNALSTY